MKILYIAPENVVGNLNTWQDIHKSRGNECRYITYFQSKFGYPEDICLHLPFVAPSPLFLTIRDLVYRLSGHSSQIVELSGYPPVWLPSNHLIQNLFNIRDIIWRKTIEPVIDHYQLTGFDLLHLETGLGFYRNGDFVKRFKDHGGRVINTFHGVELRYRGVIPAIDRLTDLNLTSELDLMVKHPNIKYLHLPFDCRRYQPDFTINSPITVCHATRNRHYKGSDIIARIGRKLERSYGIRFLLIENQTHAETLRLKSESNIYIDQVGNIAPGYGMNSLEAMATGSACLCQIDEVYQRFMPDHPFIHVTPETLETQLIQLIEAPERIRTAAEKSYAWLRKTHDLNAVGDRLYNYYGELGLAEI